MNEIHSKYYNCNADEAMKSLNLIIDYGMSLESF